MQRRSEYLQICTLFKGAQRLYEKSYQTHTPAMGKGVYYIIQCLSNATELPSVIKEYACRNNKELNSAAETNEIPRKCNTLA